MKHTPPPAPPALARDTFGDRLPLAERYVQMLATSGVERGLIGPREVDRLWDRHVLNSAAVSAQVPLGAAVLDIGSGAGLPGVPLALARPDVDVTLVEPLLRRVTFLHEMVDALAVRGLSVRRARAEELPRASTPVVVARAVAPLDKLVRWAVPLLTPGGRLVAMKGERAQAELDAAAPALERLDVASSEVCELVLGDASVATRAVVVVAGDGLDQR